MGSEYTFCMWTLSVWIELFRISKQPTQHQEPNVNVKSNSRYKDGDKDPESRSKGPNLTHGSKATVWSVLYCTGAR